MRFSLLMVRNISSIFVIQVVGASEKTVALKIRGHLTDSSPHIRIVSLPQIVVLSTAMKVAIAGVALPPFVSDVPRRILTISEKLSKFRERTSVAIPLVRERFTDLVLGKVMRNFDPDLNRCVTRRSRP